MNLYQSFLLETREEPRDRLTRRRDYLADFFMRQRQRGTNRFIVLRARVRQIQEKPRHLSFCGTREPQILNLLICCLINAAQNLRHSQSRVPMRPQKSQEFFAWDEIDLDRFERLCRYLV